MSLEERRSRDRKAKLLKGLFLTFTPRSLPGIVFEGSVIKSPRNE